MCHIAILIALITFAFAAQQIKSNVPTLDGRIVGGEDVQIEEYPYQISLQQYGSHICGGSIISERYVVTAAHCTRGSYADILSVRVGSSFRGVGGTIIAVAKIHQSPQYNPKTIDYDISVLELASPITFNAAAAPITLPSEGEEVAVGTVAYCTGWGRLIEAGVSLPDQLQGIHVPIVSRASCRTAYGSSSISDRMICAGIPNEGKDACQGDSGGPLVANGQLVGIVSWGYGCARPKHPGVYSNVADLRSYIKEVSGI